MTDSRVSIDKEEFRRVYAEEYARIYAAERAQDNPAAKDIAADAARILAEDAARITRPVPKSEPSSYPACTLDAPQTKRGRGRPPGTGKHWTDFAQRQLYTRMAHIFRPSSDQIKRDRCSVRTAARVWLSEGHVYVNVAARRYWTDRNTDFDREPPHPLAALVALYEPGNQRKPGDSVESVKSKFLAVQRRFRKARDLARIPHAKLSPKQRREVAFFESCRFWLKFEELHEQLGNPDAAFEAACSVE